MKNENRLTKEEIQFIVSSQRLLKSRGIDLSNRDIQEGLLGAIGSMLAGGVAGGALYWWLSDDAEDVMEDIQDKMKDVLDSSEDLLDSMEDLYGEIDNDDVKAGMEKSGAAAAEKIKAVMSEAYETIKSEMQELSTKKEEGEESAEKEEEKAEAAEGAGGAGPMAFSVMAAAVAKVLKELFAE